MDESQRLIVVVNKSAETIVLLRNLVEEAGFSCVGLNAAASSEDEIVEFVSGHAVDLVLFDVSWPYEENREAFLRMAADPRASAAKWIAMSTNDSMILDLQERGHPGVIGKPFDLGALMELVGQTMLDRGGDRLPM